MAQHVQLCDLSTEATHLYDALNGESDLSAVIVAAAFIDSAIHGLLTQILNVPETESVRKELLNGALGSLRNRTNMAFCLGLLSKRTFGDVNTIAEIRNQVAHVHKPIGFDTPAIREKCDRLKSWELAWFGETKADRQDASEEQLAMAARNKFKISALIVFDRIVIDAMSIEIDPSYRPRV